MNGIAIEEKAIEPLGESLSDYEAAGEVAKKLGLYDEYTDKLTVDEKIKWGYEVSGCADAITWEELNDKGYYYIRTEDDWEKYPAGMSLFCQDPEKYPLKTPTGKLEFFSQRLADHFPDDKERPPVSQVDREGPQPRRAHLERAGEEVSAASGEQPSSLADPRRERRHHLDPGDPHLQGQGLRRLHVRAGVDQSRRRRGPGHQGRRHRQAHQRARHRPGRGHRVGAHHAGRHLPGPRSPGRHDLTEAGNSIDRGGANNLISPANGTSQNCWGMATSGYLVDVQKVTAAEMEEWREKFPQAFERDYAPAAGLRYMTWIKGEE